MRNHVKGHSQNTENIEPNLEEIYQKLMFPNSTIRTENSQLFDNDS